MGFTGSLKPLSSKISAMKSFEPDTLPTPIPFGYVRMQVKARKFLAAGPDVYHRSDALSKPKLPLSQEELLQLRSGMEQLLAFKGVSPENPFTGLEVDGFYLLLDTLHYQFQSQRLLQQGPDAFVDAMTMEHQVTSETITLFNAVSLLYQL